MNKSHRVSIIIPSYNSASFITRCLNALLSQKTDVAHEIIVVDSSTDNTPSLIRDKFPGINLIHSDKQLFPGAARNIGAKQAKGDILAFIDSDCVAQSDWVNSLVKKIDQNFVIVGGAVENATAGSVIGTADYIITFNEFLPGTPEGEVTFLPTCNFICRRDVFEEMGGFPPDWLAGEDFLFCFNASKKHKLLFTRSVIVSHINRENFMEFLFHHYNFGKHGAMTRNIHKLPGTVFTQQPLLAPLILFARFMRISWRIIRWNKRLLPQFIFTSPIIIIGVCAWSYGFLTESLSAQSL